MFPTENTLPKGHPFRDLLLFGLLLIAGLFVGQFLGTLVLMPYFDFNTQLIFNTITPPFSSPAARVPILLFQAGSALGTFVLAPGFYCWIVEKRSPLHLSPRPEDANSPLLWAMGIGAILSSMPMVGYLGAWNAQLPAPELFRSMDEQANLMTAYLLRFANGQQFLLGLMVVAGMAALAEEYCFRGVLQPLMGRLTGNPHLAVWGTALVFSLIHLQFSGTVPRIVLGALLGYLYLWSGRLSVPMFAHFANNAYTVITVYLQPEKLQEFAEGSEELPGILPTLALTALSAALLWGVWQKARKPAPQP